MKSQVKTPVTIYLVHHPECEEADKLAARLYDWFRLGHLEGSSDKSGLPISEDSGLPVFFRRQIKAPKDEMEISPEIRFKDAELNVVVLLVDYQMVASDDWRGAIVSLANRVSEMSNDKQAATRAILLPAALDDSLYRTGPVYENHNPVRLTGLDFSQSEAVIRRAATEATARMLRAADEENPPPLEVFLSHAKLDGTPIAESIREGVASFGQLRAWYDANDLPLGRIWNEPMVKAVRSGTAAMVATVTDAYPTRPWCRREALLARTPERMKHPTQPGRKTRVWKLQPVVAVHQPGMNWVRGVPMLEGVPRMGWSQSSMSEDTERVVDRLVLEVLLGLVHRKVALQLDQRDLDMHPAADRKTRKQTCFISWVPDSWTLAALRDQLKKKAASIRRIVYPGYGLTAAEIDELRPVIRGFHRQTQLVSFEEAWDDQSE